MNDNRNLILAVLLSALVLIAWSFLQESFLPSNPPPKVENGQVKPREDVQASPVPTTPAAMRDRAQVLAETPRVQIRTPSLQGSINLRGARVDDLVLVRERQTMDRNSPPVRLLSVSYTHLTLPTTPYV